MVKLKRSEMRIFDDAFQMHGGYVLDFSNRTFEEFFEDEFDIEIYQEKYSFNGSSKAKYLRAFIDTEDGPIVAKIARRMWAYREDLSDYDPASPQIQKVKNKLIALLDRLESDTTDGSAESQSKEKPTVFISYAKEDADHARRLYKDLRGAGIDAWRDEESLLPGQNWKAAIESAISDSRYFVAILSNNSISKKGFVQKELKSALDILDLYPVNEIYVIPARVEDCPIADPKLKEIHYVDLFPDYEFGLGKLLNAIGRTSPTGIENPQGNPANEGNQYYLDSVPAPDQVEAARAFLEGIETKRDEISSRETEEAVAKLARSKQIESLIDEIEAGIAIVSAALNEASGQRILIIQTTEFPKNIFDKTGAYRMLISFKSDTHWLVRFVTYPNKTLALQIVKVFGKPDSNVADNFNLTNDSINLIFYSAEKFGISQNTRISKDVALEVVKKVPRTKQSMQQLPETAVQLLKRAIELELVRQKAE